MINVFVVLFCGGISIFYFLLRLSQSICIMDFVVS